MTSYLHWAVVAQFLWNGDDFVEVDEPTFVAVERGECVICSKNGCEYTLNYVLVLREDPGFVTFDVGFGNVHAAAVEAASRLCRRLEYDDDFARRHGYNLYRWEAVGGRAS